MKFWRQNKKILSCLAAAFIAMSFSRPIPAAEAQQASPGITSVSQSANQFAFDLYAKLRAAGDANLFFSPQSISTALAMTYSGARGETAAQMSKALHFTLTGDKLAKAEAALLKQLNEAGKKGVYQLNIANRLWGQKGYKFLDDFLNTLRDDYDADLEQLDFASQTEQARQTINTWVEKATSGKIKDLIPRGALNSATSLVLTNAVYFKGNWEHQFQSDFTKSAPFSVSADKKIDVPLMYQKAHFQFGKKKLSSGEGIEILALPYKDQELSMVLLLPDQIDGLSALEKELTADSFKKWSDGLGTPEVKVWLPKFKMSAQFDLSDPLSALGMPLAFSPDKADFSGMDGKRDLYITSVVHKAYVDVNEQGTEAAAATGVIVGAMAMRAPRKRSVPITRLSSSFAIIVRGRFYSWAALPTQVPSIKANYVVEPARPLVCRIIARNRLTQQTWLSKVVSRELPTV